MQQLLAFRRIYHWGLMDHCFYDKVTFLGKKIGRTEGRVRENWEEQWWGKFANPAIVFWFEIWSVMSIPILNPDTRTGV